MKPNRNPPTAVLIALASLWACSRVDAVEPAADAAKKTAATSKPRPAHLEPRSSGGESTSSSLPLHERIDRLIERELEGKFALPATDGEFVRRVYLDLTGMIPSADEARDFIDDPSPYKRDRLIDRLLAAPTYARRMQIAFDVMLMERRDQQKVPADQWKTYLYQSFLENKPYDQLANEILSADGSDPTNRGPSKFYLEREGDPYILTRDVGRLFLGRDMQCAQCHDHPLVDDYKQAHYHGLYAFFSRTYGVQPAAGGFMLGEKGEGDVTYKSVFKKKITHSTGPRVLDGAPPVEPTIAKGDEYWVAPANGIRAIPKHSRRALLPAALASDKNPAFARNAANRLWALFLGRGLVDPVDFDHSDNPPSHPELLDLLANEFAQSHYNIKALVHEIMLTRTYQRSSEPPPDVSPAELGAARYAVANLRPLSAEQLAWSVTRAAGIVDAKRAEVERSLIGVDPRFRAIAELDSKRKELAERLIESETYRSLAGNEHPFVHFFSAGAGQSQDRLDPTVHQALFLSNGDPIRHWLGPTPSWLVGRASALTDPAATADLLYLALLSRRPTGEERAAIVASLAPRTADKPRAVQEIAWAIVASSEFRYNH